MTSTSFHIDFFPKTTTKTKQKITFYLQLLVMKRRQYIKCHQTGIAKIESLLQMDLMHDDKTIT